MGESKENFYDKLSNVIDTAPSYDLKIVMGDFNMQIGSDNRHLEDVILI